MGWVSSVLLMWVIIEMCGSVAIMGVFVNVCSVFPSQSSRNSGLKVSFLALHRLQRAGIFFFNNQTDVCR